MHRAVRCRPQNKREADLKSKMAIAMDLDRGTAEIDGQCFTYDFSFPSSTTQMELFQAVGVDCTRNAYRGFNVSLFAYGQTGAGKSYSMMGPRDYSANVGLTPRIARAILFCMERATAEGLLTEWAMTASYLEIYNEKIRDRERPFFLALSPLSPLSLSSLFSLFSLFFLFHLSSLS